MRCYKLDAAPHDLFVLVALLAFKISASLIEEICLFKFKKKWRVYFTGGRLNASDGRLFCYLYEVKPLNLKLKKKLSEYLDGNFSNILLVGSTHLDVLDLVTASTLVISYFKYHNRVCIFLVNSHRRTICLLASETDFWCLNQRL